MALDPIVQGYTWRCEVLVSPTGGDTAADVTTALTGATPYIKLVDDETGASVLAATAGTLDASTRTLVFTLDTTATSGLALGQHLAVFYVVNGSDKWRVVAVAGGDEARLVEVITEADS